MHQGVLEGIKANDYQAPPGYTVQDFTPYLLTALAASDGYLRDELALEILWAWISRSFYSAWLVTVAASSIALRERPVASASLTIDSPLTATTKPISDVSV